MVAQHSEVCIVDDDAVTRRVVGALVQSIGVQAVPFSSAKSFLDHSESLSPGCAVVELRLADMSGLELQRKLTADGVDIPIIMIIIDL